MQKCRLTPFFLLLLGLGSIYRLPAQIVQHDTLIPNVTVMPNFAGSTVQLFVREKGPDTLLNNLAASYEDKVVLMIHGFSAPSEVVYDLDYQDYSWMERLAERGYDVFTMDLTGYGYSTRPAPMNDSCNLSGLSQLGLGINCPPNYSSILTTTDSEMDDIDAVVDYILARRNIAELHLLGHSLGAPRVLLYTSRYPNKVSKVTVHGMSALFGYGPADPPAQLPSAGSPIGSFQRGQIEAWANGAECFDQLDTALVDTIWKTLQRIDSRGANWGTGVSRYPSVELYGLTEDTMNAITKPLLFLAGEHDPIAPLIGAQAAFNDLGSTNKILVQINRTSHSPYWETKRYWLYDLIDDFFRDSEIDAHTTGYAIAKLNDTFDWVGELDETTAPVLLSTFPATQATGVPRDIDLDLEVDENIFSFNDSLTLRRTSDNSIFQTIGFTDPARVDPYCTNRIHVDIDTLDPLTTYCVQIDAGAFRDRSFNDFAGINDCVTWTFTTGLATDLGEVAPPAALRLYPNPNPSAGPVRVQWPANAEKRGTIWVLDLAGKVVFAQQGDLPDALDLSDLPGGMYVLELQLDRQRYRTRFIRQ